MCDLENGLTQDIPKAQSFVKKLTSDNVNNTTCKRNDTLPSCHNEQLHVHMLSCSIMFQIFKM